MCSLGGTQKSTSTYVPSGAATQEYQNAWTQAQNAASTPFQSYTGQFTAGINPLQNQAISGIQQSANLYQPYFGQAQNLASQAGQPISVTPFSSDALQQYQNPYTNQVVNATMKQLAQQQGQDTSKLQGNELMSGAFGGSRSAINQANLAGQQELASGQTLSGLLNQGYQQAVGEFNQQQGLSLQEQEAQRQNAMQAAGLYGQLGGEAQNFGLQNAQALMGAGTLEQQTQQNQLTSQYNEFLAGRQYPFETSQFLTNAATGLGSLMGGTTTTATPKPFFSDERVKEKIEHIGHSYDGQKIYKFNYKGDPTPQIGYLAQEVEKEHPEAVGHHNGIKTVDYDAATSDSAKRKHFADGGAPTNPYEVTAPTVAPLGSVNYVPESALQPETAPAKQQVNGPQGSQTSTLGDLSQAATAGKNLWDLGSNIVSGLGSLFALSDERFKENIHTIGETFTGQKIYRYNYKGDPSTRMGMLAQEVEKKHPEAVGDFNGIKTVNYDAATKEDQKRKRYAYGGVPSGPTLGGISYVPPLQGGGAHGSTMPQPINVPQSTSTLADINKAYNDVSNIWNKTPQPVQNYVKSLAPGHMASPNDEGGLYARGGSVRPGYADGGSTDDDTPPQNTQVASLNPLLPSALGVSQPASPLQAAALSPDKRQAAIDTFLNGVGSMEGGPSGGVSSDRSSKPYGKYQIDEGTWGDTIDRHPELGLKPEDRFDNKKQDILMRARAEDVAQNLDKKSLPVTPENLYSSHFLGTTGGPQFSQATQENPNDYAYRHASTAAVKSNDSIFFKPDSTPRTLGEVNQLMNRGLTTGQGWNLKTPLEQTSSAPPSPSDLNFSGTSTPSGGQSTLDNLLTVPKEGMTPLQKGLMSGVFGMLASPSTTFLGSLGEGGLKGMGAYETGQNQDIQRSLNTANMQRAQAQTQMEQQRLGFEQQKFPYEIQNERMKIGLEGQKIAYQVASMFPRAVDPKTGQVIHTDLTGKPVSEDYVGQIYSNLLNASMSAAQYGQQISGGTAQPLSPTPISNQGTPLISGTPTSTNLSAQPTPAQKTIAAPVTPTQQGNVTGVTQKNQPSTSPTQQPSIDTQQQESDFYKKNNVPDYLNPQALKASAAKDLEFADRLNQLPGLSSVQKQQLDDARKSAEDKNGRAKSIEDAQFTQDANHNTVWLTDLMKQKNQAAAQATYTQELPKNNQALLQKSSDESQAAKTIYATTKNIRDLMYDDKSNQFKFKTGSFEGTRSAASNLLATLGIDNVKDDNGNNVSLAKMLTGVQPGDNKMLAHIMTMATPEMTKYQIPGQRFTQGELMQIANGNISADMLPKVILEMIDTQILPGTKYQIDKDNYLQSKEHNKATDDYQSLANQYDKDHPMDKTYEDARNEFNKKVTALPSQSPFSETGKGLKTAAQNLLGMNPSTPTPPERPAPLPPVHMINGHQMFLWPDGKYRSGAPSSPGMRGD